LSLWALWEGGPYGSILECPSFTFVKVREEHVIGKDLPKPQRAFVRLGFHRRCLLYVDWLRHCSFHRPTIATESRRRSRKKALRVHGTRSAFLNRCDGSLFRFLCASRLGR